MQAMLKREREGRLTAKLAWRVDAMGRLREQVVYDPHELASLPRRSLRPVSKDPDELAARAIECFEMGWNDNAVVIELRASFEKVKKARQDWMDAGGATRILTTEIMAGLQEFVGPFETATELLERVREAFMPHEPAKPSKTRAA